MACEGIKPVAAIYSTFLQRGFDRSSTICLQNLNASNDVSEVGLTPDTTAF